MNPNEADLIIPPQGICMLISRAWTLFRLHMREGITIILAPTVAFSAFMMLLALSATHAPQVATTNQMLALGLLIGLVALGTLIVFFFVYGYTCCTLMRFFYSAIIGSSPSGLKQCWQFVWGLRWNLAAIFMGSVGLMMIFMLTDAVIFFAAGSLSVAALAALGGFNALAHNPLILMVTVVGFILFGFLLLAFMIGMLSGQWFMLLFPLLSVVTSETGRPIGQLLKNGLRQISRNFPRMVLFGLALFIFSFAISITLHLPVYTWVWYEKARLGNAALLTMPMRVVINLWSSLVSIVLMPFYLSAVTLFWYDCQVRREGLDLRLWLANLRVRLGRPAPQS